MFLQILQSAYLQPTVSEVLVNQQWSKKKVYFLLYHFCLTTLAVVESQEDLVFPCKR